jgi:acetyl-CoA C-acetyltransferase
MQKIFIIDACRTAIGNFNGSLSQIKPQNYSAELIKHILKKFPEIQDKINKVIIGHVLQAGFGQNTARQASIFGGLSNNIPAYGVNHLCGSGLKSVTLACQELQNNNYEFILAGGHENMSLAPHFFQSRHDKNLKKFGDITLIDSILSDGLTDAFCGYHMGITAENLAKKYSISRKEQDEYALSSQNKASLANKNNMFDDEIVPISIKDALFFNDEFIRHETNLEKLQKLKPAFSKENEASVTAGNSSGINDGSSIILLANENAVKKYNLRPIAEIISYSDSAVAPEFMGIGPVEACKNSLKCAGWEMNDLDLIEINEAFSAQILAVVKELNIDVGKLNIKGGAIALGHPIGASGARCLTTLVHSLKQKKLEKGLVSLCIGGGMGIAACIRNIIN